MLKETVMIVNVKVLHKTPLQSNHRCVLRTTTNIIMYIDIMSAYQFWECISNKILLFLQDLFGAIDAQVYLYTSVMSINYCKIICVS